MGESDKGAERATRMIGQRNIENVKLLVRTKANKNRDIDHEKNI